jgi:hypothetical protein
LYLKKSGNPERGEQALAHNLLTAVEKIKPVFLEKARLGAISG